MAYHQNPRSKLVVSASPWSINTVLLVTVFLVTSALVYHWSHVAGSPADNEPEYTASATIHHAELSDEATGHPLGSPSDDHSARIEQQVRSRKCLEAAVLKVTTTAAQANERPELDEVTPVVDQLRTRIQVALEESGAGQVGVRLSYADSDPHRAAELLRAVVEEYAGSVRKAWKIQTERVHANAALAVDQARREWQLAEAKRQEFVDTFLREQEKETQSIPPVSPPAPTAPPTPAPRVGNPKWVQLSEQAARLEQRRSELLVDRLPAHPEVQELEHELAEIRKALAGNPQWITSESDQAIPEPGLGNPPAAQPAHSPPEPAVEPKNLAREHTRAREQVQRLGQEVEAARRRYEQLAAAERAAWSAYVREPEIEISVTQPVKKGLGSTAAHEVLPTSLLAGLSMMVGLGMFVAGAAMEPTLTTADQVSALIGAPIVATVTLPGLRPACSGRHRSWLRIAFCVGGVILMAGCTGLLYRALAG